MWFQFPEGSNSISVNQQVFVAEAKDGDGREYFRAPDHFAAQILDLGLGFKVMAPPSTDLKDLPKADPDRDSAIVRLSSQVDALQMEKDDALAQLEPLQKENKALQARVDELEEKIQEMFPDVKTSSSTKKDEKK